MMNNKQNLTNKYHGSVIAFVVFARLFADISFCAQWESSVCFDADNSLFAFPRGSPYGVCNAWSINKT